MAAGSGRHCEAALQMLDTAYQNFFRRVRQGGNPGYPRFKSKRIGTNMIEPLPSTGAVAGIGMGLKVFAVISDGVEYPNHKHLT